MDRDRGYDQRRAFIFEVDKNTNNLPNQNKKAEATEEETKSEKASEEKMTIRERIAKMREEIQARNQMGQSNSQEQKKNTEAVEEKKTEKASEQKMSTRERIAKMREEILARQAEEKKNMQESKAENKEQRKCQEHQM